jgi:ABC-type branched-subunit amino acid transport system substrate-binding protein
MDPPNITWRELTKPYGHTHSNGRKHGPFDTESLIKAVVEGVDPDGNKMHPSMPRYLLSEKDAHALIAYLRVIDKDLDPGLTGSSIKLGVLLPGQDNDQNPLYALVRGFFTELNAKGGIYGRKVEPVFGKPFGNTLSYIESVKNLVEEKEVFALFGASMADADPDLFPLFKQNNIPLIAPLLWTKREKIKPQRLRFRLLPGPVQQVQTLTAFANKRLKSPLKTAIITPSQGEIYGQIWDTFQSEVKRYGWPDFESRDFSGDPKEMKDIVVDLAEAGTQAVFYFGPPGKLAPLMLEASKHSWNPYVLAPMRVAAREALSLPPDFDSRVFLSAPSLPGDYDKKSLQEFQDLLRKYKIPKYYQVQTLYYLATLKVLTEGLQRSGQKLSRSQLVEALESINNFETGLTPKISFGPNRRTGSLGSHILEIDLVKRRFKPGTVWIRLD